jgi:hypothetical protein
MRPRHQLAVLGLLAHLQRAQPRGLGVLPLTEVVVQAPEERGQPAGLDHDLAVLGEGQTPAEQSEHVRESLLGAVAQEPRGCARVRPAQQIDRLLHRLDGTRADVGDIGRPGRLHRGEELGLGPQRVLREDARRDQAALPLPAGRHETDVLHRPSGQLLQRPAVRRVRPQHLAAFPAADAFLVAQQPLRDPRRCAVHGGRHLGAAPATVTLRLPPSGQLNIRRCAHFRHLVLRQKEGETRRAVQGS